MQVDVTKKIAEDTTSVSSLEVMAQRHITALLLRKWHFIEENSRDMSVSFTSGKKWEIFLSVLEKKTPDLKSHSRVNMEMFKVGLGISLFPQHMHLCKNTHLLIFLPDSYEREAAESRRDV